jgi:hypothetical protein
MKPMGAHFCLLLILAACAPPEVGPPIDTGPVGPETSFSSLSQRIFIPRCATSSCHAGSPPSFAPMSLEEGQAYASLVGVASKEAPSLQRVSPGRPDQSYLLYKLHGTGATVGGLATRMPLGQDPLTDADIADIESWIAGGAPND